MMERYKAYKESGLPWLDTIPEHWEVKRIKDIFTEIKEVVGERSDDYTLLSLSTQGVIERDIVSGKGKFPKEFNSYKIVNPTNLVFCLFDVDETPRTVGYVQQTGMLTGAYDVFSVSNANTLYVYYYFIALDNEKSLKPLYRGLRKVIPMISFMSMPIYLPPLEEQQAIAEYLDRETVRIDRIVELLTKQRERYAQLKRSLISEVVTHGLPHHNYTMKEANLPWLRTIPEHWEVRRIKDILSSVFSGDWGDEPIENNSYVCVRIADFDNRTGKVVFKDTPTYRSYPINSIDSKQIHNGDILLEKSGGGELVPVARVVLWDRAKEYSPCLCANFIQVLRTKRNEVIPMYLMHLLTILHTMDIVRLHIKQTTGIQNLSLNTYLNQSLPLPPLEEQQEIVAYLDERCKRLDRLVEAIDRKIELLGSLKKSLIEEVVTGQRRITN